MTKNKDSQYQVNNRRKRKLNLIEVAGGQCCLCGYHKLPDALEFHHLDPDTKDYTISNTSYALETDLKEIKKCILVCANCHREIHKGLYTLEELQEKQVFKEDVAERLLYERNKILYGEKRYCKNCGAELSAHAQVTGLCGKCFKESTRKAERPPRDELKELIRNKTFVEIGKCYGVTDNAVRKWCELVHLPRTKKEIKKYTDEEWKEI